MKLACPSCGANIIYLIGTDQVVCEHCGQKTNVSNVNINEYISYSKQLRETALRKEKENNEFVFQDSNEVSFRNTDLLFCKKCNSSFIMPKSDNSSIRKCPFCRTKWIKCGTTIKKVNASASKIIPFNQSIVEETILDKKTEVILPKKRVEIYEHNIKSPIGIYEYVQEMYLPFLISYDEIKFKNSKIKCSENIMTLQYAGKNFEYKNAQNIVNFDFRKMVALDKNLLPQDSTIDHVILDEKVAKKRHLKNVETFLKNEIKFETKDLTFEISQKKDALECKNIKNEIILLPFYIYKDDKFTYLINGQNGEYTKYGLEKHDTMPDNIFTGVFLSPFLLVSIFIVILIVFTIIQNLLSFNINSIIYLIIALPMVLWVISPWGIILKTIKKNSLGKRFIDIKYNVEISKFYGLSWDKNIQIESSDANE